MKPDLPVRVCLFGAAPDTGNLGVCALFESVVAGLARRIPGLRLTVFDHGRGLRAAGEGRSGALPSPPASDGSVFTYSRCGAVRSRRFYRRESHWNIAWSARLGGLGNPAARCVRDACAVLDISGGDSFTDLYGWHRFEAVAFPKRLARQCRRALILLPQTYGPFLRTRARAAAEAIVRGAAAAWARDARSYAVLCDLAGGSGGAGRVPPPTSLPTPQDADGQRFRQGVDVAFELEAREPPTERADAVRAWLGRDAGAPVVGLNVSGLIFNDPVGARQRFDFRADYADVIDRLLRQILQETDARVLLIPHVTTPVGHYESDIGANAAVLDRLGALARGRIFNLGGGLSAAETKWVIRRCDWFCGTRMHACIAGLSSGVPTAAIAYSLKTLGVFETCGQGEHVVDPRVGDTADVVARLWDSWQGRPAAAERLRERLPAVLATAKRQMDEIATQICALAQADGRAGGRPAFDTGHGPDTRISALTCVAVPQQGGTRGAGHHAHH